uniref:Uncharacterized protein n=1 Tax=Tanacetum cinerariifolium TaxID=118510 RepID=A0A699GK69_TANCI|nr:hypothetical protein [Tanacetum cinerariifolium]
MRQPWRTFVAIINRFISSKITGLDRLTESRAQILQVCLQTQDYQQYRALIPDEMINQHIKDSKAYKTYLDFANEKDTPKKARKFKKVASPSKKLSLVLEKVPTVKPDRAKKPAKKSTTVPTAYVVIKDTPSEFVSKKKTPAKVDRGKDMDLLSDVMELVSNQKFLMSLKTRQLVGTSTKPEVPDVPKYQSKSKNESWGDSDDDESDDVTKDDDDVDGDNEASNSEKTDSDEDENPNLNQNEDKEEEYKEEYVHTPYSYGFTDDDEECEELYKDVNVRLKDAEHEEERKGDAKMIDVGHDDSSQQTTYEQVKDDEHCTRSNGSFVVSRVSITKIEK